MQEKTDIVEGGMKPHPLYWSPLIGCRKYEGGWRLQTGGTTISIYAATPV